MVALVSSFLQYNGYELNFSTRSIAYSLLVLICVRIINYRYTDFNQSPSIAELESIILLPQVNSSLEKEEEMSQGLNLELRRSVLDEEDMKGIWLKLEDCMKQQVVFADCDLNLDKLAALSNLNKYHISETLNRYAEKSFYQYINEYRTNHVVGKLNDLHSKDIHVNMLNLAFDAGFKSKSSFNRYFKELTGQTPSEYFRSLTKMETQTV
jgi:AraC-like DNA-binding protein